MEGLFIYQDEKLIPFLSPLPELKDIDAIEGSGNDLWVNSKERGTFHYQFSTGKLTKLAQFPTVRKIEEDGDSTLLVVTNTGIKVISKYDSSTAPIREYTTLDGLPSNDIRDIHRLGDTALLVATFEGMHKIDRTLKVHMPLNQEALSIKSFKINDQDFPLDSLPVFSHQQKDLDVAFNLQDYASNGQIKYSFKLLPIEEGWRESQERSARYSSLDPGE